MSKTIDKDKSNDRHIENQRARTWEEYCKKMEGKNSYYFDGLLDEVEPSCFCSIANLSEFQDRKDTEAYAAFSKLLKLRKDWIGEWEPDYENVCEPKFAIITVENKISKEGENYTVNSSMSFPTKKMRDEFFDTFRELLEIAKPLL